MRLPNEIDDTVEFVAFPCQFFDDLEQEHRLERPLRTFIINRVEEPADGPRYGEQHSIDVFIGHVDKSIDAAGHSFLLQQQRGDGPRTTDVFSAASTS